MFKTSRGLAQMSSSPGKAERISTDAAMSGIGSTPASAIRPAKTETKLDAASAKASATVRTCRVVINAVTFSLRPSATRSRISGPDASP
jgi:hypothetical protein